MDKGIDAAASSAATSTWHSQPKSFTTQSAMAFQDVFASICTSLATPTTSATVPRGTTSISRSTLAQMVGRAMTGRLYPAGAHRGTAASTTSDATISAAAPSRIDSTLSNLAPIASLASTLLL